MFKSLMINQIVVFKTQTKFNTVNYYLKSSNLYWI